MSLSTPTIRDDRPIRTRIMGITVQGFAYPYKEDAEFVHVYQYDDRNEIWQRWITREAFEKAIAEDQTIDLGVYDPTDGQHVWARQREAEYLRRVRAAVVAGERQCWHGRYPSFCTMCVHDPDPEAPKRLGGSEVEP